MVIDDGDVGKYLEVVMGEIHVLIKLAIITSAISMVQTVMVVQGVRRMLGRGRTSHGLECICCDRRVPISSIFQGIFSENFVQIVECIGYL